MHIARANIPIAINSFSQAFLRNCLFSERESTYGINLLDKRKHTALKCTLLLQNNPSDKAECWLKYCVLESSDNVTQNKVLTLDYQL